MRRIDQNYHLTTIFLMGMMAVSLLLAGCKPFEKRPQALLPLKSARMTSESVVLDMFFVRVPFGDEAINGPFWNEIDEQKVPPALRQKLAENGFRTGVISGPIPVQLSQLLQLEGKTQVDNLNEDSTPVKELQKVPEVERRHLQLRCGRRGDIVTNEMEEELPVILRDTDGNISGETLYGAEPRFVVYTTNCPDGRVQLCLTPEIQHGQTRREFTGGRNGMWQLDIGREKRLYEELQIDATLNAGDFLVLSSIPVREGSLGNHFFCESSAEGRVQKILVIRLSQTQHDDQFE